MRIKILLAVSLIYSCAYAQQKKTTKRPNIVYVMSDQWRGQSMGYMGDPNVKTPNLDALAAKSVNFANAVSVLPVCTPYRAALLTGRYPTSTGMFVNDIYLPEKEETMAEIFKQAGYNTGYIGKWHLDGHGRTTFIPRERRQGFDYWKANECTHNYNKSIYYDNEDTTARYWEGYDVYAQTNDAARYITDHAKDTKPFVLLLALGAPHFPHNTAPENFKKLYSAEKLIMSPNVTADQLEDAKKEAIGYYAHCTAIDSAMGGLLNTIDAAGIADNTIFVFTSDHGEMLGSQGVKPRTKQYFWDESAKVPFLIRYPGIAGKAGYKTTLPISNVDVLPTLLGLCGIDKSDRIEGQDISGVLTGKQNIPDRAVLLMNVASFNDAKNKEFRGIRTSQYTYVKQIDGKVLLFDDQNDPYQMKNLSDLPQHKALSAKLDKMLGDKLREIGDEFKPREYYLKKWGYTVNNRGAIPYDDKETTVQSPKISSTKP
jgi:arylsulfatase A-like enzyme